MSDDQRSFFDKYSTGDALPDEIDDYIDAWHNQSDTSQQLHEYLGLTWEEYSVWVHDPLALPFILQARRQGRSLRTIMENRVSEAQAEYEPGEK